MIIPHITTSQFLKGFVAARNNEIRKYGLGDIIEEEMVVEIIRNLTEIAREGHNVENMIRQDAGIIVGWVVRCCEASNK